MVNFLKILINILVEEIIIRTAITKEGYISFDEFLAIMSEID